MPATSLDDLSIPLVDAIALLVGPRRANLRNLGRVAHRYLKPAQKALLHSIKLVPGAQLESLTAFIRVLPWAAHSIHRLIMPSRPQEIPYISGRAAFDVLRLAAHVTDLNIGLTASELIKCVDEHEVALRKLRLVKLDLTCMSYGGREAARQEQAAVRQEQAVLDFVATSASTLRDVCVQFGYGSRWTDMSFVPGLHDAVDQLADPFRGKPVRMRKLRRLFVAGGSIAVVVRIADASPNLREFDPNRLATLSALQPATLAHIRKLYVDLPWDEDHRAETAAILKSTAVRQLVVRGGDLDPFAVPSTVGRLEVGDKSCEPEELAVALEDPRCLLGLRKLVYDCEHPPPEDDISEGEEDGDEDERFTANEREEHDDFYDRIAVAAATRGIKLYLD